MIRYLHNRIIELIMRYKTGNIAPTTGNYRWDGHTEDVSCSITHEEYIIPLTTGERFPPTKHCEQGAYWVLVT